MRSTTSPDCATARRSIHDQFPSDRGAKRSAHQCRVQTSPMPQVSSRIPQRVGWRADLFSLQKYDHMAKRHAA